MLSLHIDAKALLGGEAVAITLDEDVHATEATPGASDGGFVQATPAPPQGIAAMRLYEVWNALGRYKPVAAVLAALVVAAIVLPGVRVIENAASPYASAVDTSAAHPAAPTEDDSVTPADDAAAVGDTATTAADLTLPSATVDLAASPAVTQATSTASDTGPTATASASASEPTDASPSTTGTTLGDAKTDPTYKVRELGWATAQAGNPVATAGIPEGGMPVGKRLGEVDKISFVRLAGSSSVLTLHVVDDPTATRLADSAGVRACRITESSWKAQTGVALDQAPSYDKSACAVGKANGDGTWTFDLRAFDDAADARGFALVPTADAASDFQVVFAQT